MRRQTSAVMLHAHVRYVVVAAFRQQQAGCTQSGRPVRASPIPRATTNSSLSGGRVVPLRRRHDVSLHSESAAAWAITRRRLTSAIESRPGHQGAARLVVLVVSARRRGKQLVLDVGALERDRQQKEPTFRVRE